MCTYLYKVRLHLCRIAVSSSPLLFWHKKMCEVLKRGKSRTRGLGDKSALRSVVGGRSFNEMVTSIGFKVVKDFLRPLNHPPLASSFNILRIEFSEFPSAGCQPFWFSLFLSFFVADSTPNYPVKFEFILNGDRI